MVCSGVSSELSSHRPMRGVRSRSAASREARSARLPVYAVFARVCSRAPTTSRARCQHDDTERPALDQVDVHREISTEHDVLDDDGQARAEVGVRRCRAQSISELELLTRPPSSSAVISSRPDTIIRRKTSPGTCAARSKRAASSSATVDFPDAETPVTRTTTCCSVNRTPRSVGSLAMFPVDELTSWMDARDSEAGHWSTSRRSRVGRRTSWCASGAVTMRTSSGARRWRSVRTVTRRCGARRACSQRCGGVTFRIRS